MRVDWMKLCVWTVLGGLSIAVWGLAFIGLLEVLSW